MTFLTGYQGFFNPSQLVTIPASDDTSDVLNCSGMVLTGINIPPSFTGTSISFLVADDKLGFEAAGSITINDLPILGDTLTINGVVLTFTSANPTSYQVLVGSTTDETAANLQSFLDSTTDPLLLACTYQTQGSVTYLTSVIHGAAGEAISISTTCVDIDISAMSGSDFRALYDDTNTLISIAVTQGQSYAVDSSLFQGVGFLKILSNDTESSLRNITCSLKGF